MKLSWIQFGLLVGASSDVDEVVQSFTNVLLSNNTVVDFDEAVKSLVHLTYADLLWMKFWKLHYWPQGPFEISIDVDPRIRSRVARAIPHTEVSRVVHRSTTRCLNPSDAEILCEVPGYNYTVEQEVFMHSTQGLREDEDIRVPVSFWSENIHGPYGWEWPLNEDSTVMVGEPFVNLQRDTIQRVPPHHSVRVESEVEKIEVEGSLSADLIIGNPTKDILEWFVTACASATETSKDCNTITVGPFNAAVARLELSPVTKATLCVNREPAMCLLRLGQDGKVHASVRARFTAIPATRINRRVWLEEPGRTDWLLSSTQTYPPAHPIREVASLI